MTTMTYGQLAEAYVAVREERDRLRAELDRLRRRLGDVLDLDELPEDHTIVAAVRRLRAALGTTPDTGRTA